MARARTKNPRKTRNEVMNEEREKARLLYKLYQTDSFDEDFFALLQSQAPDDQKLRESSVEPDKEPYKKSLVKRPPPRSVRKNPATKKPVPASSVKKPTPKTPAPKKPNAKTPTANLPTPSAIDAKPTVPPSTPLPNDPQPSNTRAEDESIPNTFDFSTVKGMDTVLASQLNFYMRGMQEIEQKRRARLAQEMGTTPPIYDVKIGTGMVDSGVNRASGTTGSVASNSAVTSNSPAQNPRKRNSLEGDTRNTRKKVKGSGTYNTSGTEHLQTTERSLPEEKASRRKSIEGKGATKTEAVIGPIPGSRSTPKRADERKKKYEKRVSDDTSETPTTNAQLLSPPESIPSIEGEQEISPSGKRPRNSLPSETSQPERNDQLASPTSMSPPTALHLGSPESPSEMVADARTSLVIPLPERWSPDLEDHVKLADTYCIDDPPSSCGYQILNDIENPSSSGEFHSKYFANNQTSNKKTIKDYFSGSESFVYTSPSPGSSENKKPRKPPAKPRARPKVISGVSKYFPISKAAEGSSLPFPSIQRKTFGLIQETLAHEPFRLLVGTIFLNRTKGHVAIPVMKEFFKLYPTVESVAEADLKDIAGIFQPLGLHNQRASKLINLAKTWLSQPPEGGRRYRKVDYPKKKDGRDIMADECLGDDDPRVAWEIAHLPGIGPYGIDSWRIFCRDELRGLATDHKGAGAADGFKPEWKSVLPQDKELRAYISWLWLKEGYSWDMTTGKLSRAKASRKRAAKKKALPVAEGSLDSGAESHGAIVKDENSSASLGPDEEV
ncbi:hypothetical protein FQN54_006517 [Arachnomyces sp. PD_36]|nr:hypothetical protein FQN54_006517 [Arachnomyces sp. PD_36]